MTGMCSFEALSCYDTHSDIGYAVVRHSPAFRWAPFF
jgi:hypothetical protein